MPHTSPCNACASLKIHAWKTIGGWRLFRCSRCRLGFLRPVPSKEDLHGLYGERYFHSDCVESEDLAAASVIDRMALVERAVGLPPGASENRTILDVGCGAGGFLAEAARRGWQTTGVEISEWAAAEARRQHGLDVVTGDILDMDFRPGTFDAVTLWDTLEHLPDPTGALRRVRGWLRPDGVLVIRVVNCESYDARIFGVKWRGWAPPYHLFHFSPRSLRACLASAGFQLLSLDSGISTVFFRFLFAPIAIPSHHSKLVKAAGRWFPRSCTRLAGMAEGRRWPVSLLRQVFPGPAMQALARKGAP